MKKVFLALTLLSVTSVGLFSCEKLREEFFPAFNVDLKPVEVTIPIIANTITETSMSQTVSFNLDSIIKKYTSNAFGVNNLVSVKINKIDFGINNADQTNNLSNFEYVRFLFSSNTNSTPVEVANTAISDAFATSITIPATTTTPELKDYLTGNQLTYTVVTKARRITTRPLNATVVVTLAVK